jgi:tetratricopeptide (TPR) repeat protein
VLSHDLLEAVGRAIAASPVLILLVYRPLDLSRLQAPRVMRLPYFTEIALGDLLPEEGAELLRLKLARREGGGPDLPPAVVAQIVERAGGNPFYIEELFNYIQSQNLAPGDAEALTRLDLPASLHSLLLSRIDSLSESQQLTLKVASVIGRLFPVPWLWGVYPDLGPRARVLADLDTLHGLDLTPLDSPTPELTYLFKHILTQEVAYGSLTYALRARLHTQLAAFLEVAVESSRAPVDLIAYHYGRGDNTATQREYYRKAGAAAQAVFANDAAIDYYERLLPLLDPPERGAAALELGGVLELVGRWDAAEARYGEALAEAEARGDATGAAHCRRHIGSLHRKRGAYPTALEWLDAAWMAFVDLDDTPGLGQALAELGLVHQLQGNYPAAQMFLQQAADLSAEAGDGRSVATALQHLGLVAAAEGRYSDARTLYEQSLALWREQGDRPGIAGVLRNLGDIAADLTEYAVARPFYEESLALQRDIGERAGVAAVLTSLGSLETDVGDWVQSRAYYLEGLTLRRELGDRAGIAQSLNNLGNVASELEDFAVARLYYEESLALRRELGDRAGVSASLNNLGVLALSEGDAATALDLFGQSLAIKQELGYGRGIARTMSNMGLATYQTGHYALAAAHWRDSLARAHDQADRRLVAYNLIGLGGVAAHEGQPERAARWAGAVAALLDETGAVAELLWATIYQHTIEAIRPALGEAAYDDLCAAGRAAPLDTIVAEAVGG